MGDVAVRNRFRTAGAHNTLRIDSMEQGTPVNPFRWSPARWKGQIGAARAAWGELNVVATVSSPDASVRITRSLTWSTGHPLICDDLIEGPAGEHLIEQFWQAPHDAEWDGGARRLTWRSGASLLISPGTEASVSPSEVSAALYLREPSQTLKVSLRTALPARLRTVIEC